MDFVVVIYVIKIARQKVLKAIPCKVKSQG